LDLHVIGIFNADFTEVLYTFDLNNLRSNKIIKWFDVDERYSQILFQFRFKFKIYTTKNKILC